MSQYADANQIATVLIQLERALNEAHAQDQIGSCEEGAQLLSSAGQALGVLKTLHSFNLNRIMDNMVHYAAAAGHCPDAFKPLDE